MSDEPDFCREMFVFKLCASCIFKASPITKRTFSMAKLYACTLRRSNNEMLIFFASILFFFGFLLFL